MRVRIEGEVGTKVQLFSSKAKGFLYALFRATYFNQKRGFAQTVELPGVNGIIPVAVPGPVDLEIDYSVLGTRLAVIVKVITDGSRIVLWSGQFQEDLKVSKKFKVTVSKGTYVEATVSLEA